ncbi:MAG: hypothetical protein JSS31_03905 [Proteobacteria bacterium]|nr:hypothetical protein [Pseudomonadota bacterium]MBS0493091.1 hypothetical protein [Pseudomonadota bacterium]
MLIRFFNPASVYMRRAQRCLDEARMAALEHENAAEHHMALAKMYRHRAARLEAELAPADAQGHETHESSGQLPRIAALKKPRDQRQAQPAFLAQSSPG